MIKRFCDVCSDPMTHQDTQPMVTLVTYTGPKQIQIQLAVKLTRAVDGVWNAGDVCIPCIQRVVAEGEFQAPLTAGEVVDFNTPAAERQS